MPSTLDVFILYEDRAAGLRAKTLLNRALNEVQPDLVPAVSVWRFDFMRDAVCRSTAAEEAATARIVIVAAARGTELPEDVQRWMHEWLDRRRPEACALVLAFEGRPEATVTDGSRALIWHRVSADRRLGLFVHAFDAKAG